MLRNTKLGNNEFEFISNQIGNFKLDFSSDYNLSARIEIFFC